MSTYHILHGDCLEELKHVPDNFVDSIITDPPAGIAFMNKNWDKDKGGRDEWIAWMEEVMREAIRCLKPGGHALVWAIPRTSHWTATALENAGFEIRDVVTHVFGSGFPKSQNISKAIEKGYLCQFLKTAKPVGKVLRHFPVVLNGEKTDSVLISVVILQEGYQGKLMVTGEEENLKDQMAISPLESTEIIDSNTLLKLNKKLDDLYAKGKKYITLTELETIIDLKIFNLLRNQNIRNSIIGQGTALKPAAENWILCRKPLGEKTIAKNVLKYGTGGINIDASRIGIQKRPLVVANRRHENKNTYRNDFCGSKATGTTIQGRFPANFVLSHHEECEYLGKKKVGNGKRTINKDSGRRAISTTAHNKRNPNLTDSICNYGTEIVADYKCHPECPVKLIDEQSGVLKTNMSKTVESKAGFTSCYGSKGKKQNDTKPRYQEGTSRFFYCAKPSKKERNQGCEEVLTWENADLSQTDLMAALNSLKKDTLENITLTIDDIEWSTMLFGNNISEKSRKDIVFIIKMAIKLITELKTSNSLHISNIKDFIRDAIKQIQENGSNLVESVEFLNQLKMNATSEKMELVLGVSDALSKTLQKMKENASIGNIHSTVKAKKLMMYLITLITPPNGLVLDPFMGSGSTGIAALEKDFNFIGIEAEKEYVDIAEARLAYIANQQKAVNE